MATHDYSIANGSGAAVRSDLNNALAAIVSNNSSATAPATTYAYMWWPDTTTGLLKIRNAANNAWVTVGTLASANLGLIPSGGSAALLSFTQTGAGAVARTVDSKLKDEISSADFSSLQQAIDAAGTSAIVQVTSTPSYNENINWNGRRHQTDNAPFLLKSFTWTGANLNARMTVAGGFLFCCEYSNSKVAIFSLADPRDPVLVAQISVGSQPRHVDVVGRYAFVCCHGANQVEVYDISNPQAASQVGIIATGSNPKMFQIVGDEIFVACYGSNQVQKFTYALPASGTAGFSSYKTAEATVAAGPLCLASNGAGLLAVCGLGTANVNLLGSSTLNSISTISVGGAGHGTCAWANRAQLLVTDASNDRLYSVNYNTIASPVISGFAATSTDPEQIEIIGNRCYVPSLTAPGTTAYLDCFDITDAVNPVKYKSVQLSATGAGFTAFYSDGDTGYVYVNGHFSPYNIDIIEVPSGPVGRLPIDANEYQQIRVAGIGHANLGSASLKYTTKTSNYTATAGDFAVRLGLGVVLTLPDPATMPDGKLMLIENVSTTATSTVSNSYAGVVSLYLYPNDSILLAAQQSSGSYSWNVVTRNTPTTSKYTTILSNYTATSADDVLRVGLGYSIALPDPATMPGKIITIKNVHGSSSSNVTNAFAGYSGTLTAGKAVTVVAMDYLGSYQWDAIGAF